MKSVASVQFLRPRTPAGYWEIGEGFRFAVYSVPSWFHRFMMRAVLGWLWVPQ